MKYKSKSYTDLIMVVNAHTAAYGRPQYLQVGHKALSDICAEFGVNPLSLGGSCRLLDYPVAILNGMVIRAITYDKEVL